MPLPSTPAHSECCPALKQGNKAPSPPSSSPCLSHDPPLCGSRDLPQVDARLLAVSARLSCVPSCSRILILAACAVAAVYAGKTATCLLILCLYPVPPALFPLVLLSLLFLLALQVNPSISFQKTPSQAPNMTLVKLAWRSTAVCLPMEAGRLTVG